MLRLIWSIIYFFFSYVSLVVTLVLWFDEFRILRTYAYISKQVMGDIVTMLLHCDTQQTAASWRKPLAREYTAESSLLTSFIRRLQRRQLRLKSSYPTLNCNNGKGHKRTISDCWWWSTIWWSGPVVHASIWIWHTRLCVSNWVSTDRGCCQNVYFIPVFRRHGFGWCTHDALRIVDYQKRCRDRWDSLSLLLSHDIPVCRRCLTTMMTMTAQRQKRLLATSIAEQCRHHCNQRHFSLSWADNKRRALDDFSFAPDRLASQWRLNSKEIWQWTFRQRKRVETGVGCSDVASMGNDAAANKWSLRKREKWDGQLVAKIILTNFDEWANPALNCPSFLMWFMHWY